MMGSPACTVLCTLQLLLTWAASLCHISGAPCLTCARAAARLRGPEQLARGEQGAGRPGREQPAPARQVLPESGRKQLRELLKEGLGDHVLYLRLFQARGWRSAPHGPPGARRRLGGGGGSLRLCWRSRRRLRACIAERSARAQPARSVWPLLMGQGCHPPLRMPVRRPRIASVSSGDCYPGKLAAQMRDGGSAARRGSARAGRRTGAASWAWTCAGCALPRTCGGSWTQSQGPTAPACWTRPRARRQAPPRPASGRPSAGAPTTIEARRPAYARPLPLARPRVLRSKQAAPGRPGQAPRAAGVCLRCLLAAQG